MLNLGTCPNYLFLWWSWTELGCILKAGSVIVGRTLPLENSPYNIHFCNKNVTLKVALLQFCLSKIWIPRSNKCFLTWLMQAHEDKLQIKSVSYAADGIDVISCPLHGHHLRSPSHFLFLAGSEQKRSSCFLRKPTHPSCVSCLALQLTLSAPHSPTGAQQWTLKRVTLNGLFQWQHTTLAIKQESSNPLPFLLLFYYFFCSLKQTAVLTKVLLQCANCAERSRLCQRKSMEVTHAPLKHKGLSLLKC